MKTAWHKIQVIYWLATALLFAVALGVLIAYTPTESSMGDIQRIFYLHLPVAISTFLACTVTFIASVGYLMQRKSGWDDLASAAARVAVQLCSIVLITGMIWGKSAWGRWWTWSPRLTFSLALWLLYITYMMIRSSISSSQRRAMVSAVYAIIAFLDVPLVYLSARMMADIHPSSVELEPAMKLTLALWFVPVFMAAAGLIVTKYYLNVSARKAHAQSDHDDRQPVHFRLAEAL
jgi:heme exporter protein C